MLDGMHRSVEQNPSRAFCQFWSPFMEDAIVPDSAATASEITHTPHRAHNSRCTSRHGPHRSLLERPCAPAIQHRPQRNVDQIFAGLFAQRAGPSLSTASVPTFLPTGTSSGQVQDMKITTSTTRPSTASSFPATSPWTSTHRSLFNFAFDTCATNPKQN